MGLKADAIVGYTYDAENLCPHCTIDSMVSDQSEIPGKSIEEKLDYIASIGANPRGEVINRHDENSFDSGVFPKVIFASMVEDNEQCYHCGERLE